ncbi:MAG TPA: FtsX-like permease family protein, partial [Longimicrobiales bacterium]|nr:FtsX-like permease family protein [Longimicrobiales bacterium]
RGSLVEGNDRSGSGPASGATRNLLIVGQVGLATTLLAVAALLARSFDELVSVPPGFEADGVVTFSLLAPSARYPERADVRAYFEEVWGELEAIPGVRGVGMTSDLPFTTKNRWTDLHPSGVDYDPVDPPKAEFHAVLPEYFGVMGIPVVDGSLFRERWDSVTDAQVVVNGRFADAFWPDTDPVGQTFVPDWDDQPVLRVGGVVGDVLDDGFTARPDPTFYVPWGAQPNRRMSVVIRIVGDPAPVLADVRQAVSRVDPDVPVADPRTLKSMLAETVARPRAASLIGGTFALLALLVAVAGVYGVLSYAVERRTREIGIRAALGAGEAQIVGTVLGHATRLMALGLAVGVVGALAAGNAVSGLLFGVRSWDPASLLLAASILGGAGLLAAWIPARRAVRIDPSEALRQG